MIARSGLLAAVIATAIAWGAPCRAADAGAAAAPEAREALAGPKLDPLLTDIAKARKGMKTLRAAFTQERRIRLLSTSVKSRGELSFGAGERLRWDLAPPDDVVYFIGPEGLSYKTKSSTATVPARGANVARARRFRASYRRPHVPARSLHAAASRGERDVEVSTPRTGREREILHAVSTEPRRPPPVDADRG